MAMGAAKGSAATLQVEMVCLDELVPEDDRYRRLDELVDWSFVREAAAPYYADELGRPSLDPIVLVKLALCGALEGLGSHRELLRIAAMRLDLRRFLGYGFGERLPVHQTISHAHTRRFVDAQLFERLFARSVALCKEHDLIDGTHLSIDGFHPEANAALQSLRASLALAAAPADDDDGAEDEDAPAETPEPPGRPQLALAPPRSGPTPRRRSSNATSASQTDPDARLRGKPGQRSTAARSQSTERRAASSPASASAPTATRATPLALCTIVRALCAPSSSRSEPIRALPPSASGRRSGLAVSRSSSRPSGRCCPREPSRGPLQSTTRSPSASAASQRRACGRTSAGWPTPRA